MHFGMTFIATPLMKVFTNTRYLRTLTNLFLALTYGVLAMEDSFDKGYP